MFAVLGVSAVLAGGVAVEVAPVERPTLVLTVVGDEAWQQRAIEVVEAHLRTAGVNVVVIPPDDARPDLSTRIDWARARRDEHAALGVVWIDAQDPRQLLLYLVDASDDRALVRSIPRAGMSEAESLEASGVIARSITAALLAGAEIGMTPVEPPPTPTPEPARGSPPEPPAPEPAPAPTLRWPRLAIAALYGGHNFADRLPWVHTVGLELAGRPLPALSLGIGYAFGIPARVDEPAVEFVLQRNPVSAFAGFHGRLGDRLAIDLRGTATVDIVRQRVVRVPSGSTAQADGTRVLFSLGAGARLWVFPWRTLGLFAGIGLDVVTNRFSYVVVRGERTEILTPHIIRGLASAGIGYGFIDRPRRDTRFRRTRH
jgi:hypothetical protein